ncbi:MAG: hypothetical protein LBH74_08315 [Nitrososphaerota archaeon]|jgi:hypothetical protein|uniref:hypothetical protein n=1 Tax=Candidatus Bathycorpusculum sp. TaxID=2994959 RepID=UPI002833A85B|nr:hypothetical protein [Candidatus Termitimicrobium sp.]MCL2431476.1 hypothetical protein [Candidatus Termitimicrobium sp.]MDR0493621.1 hypothetical protein [Nitrososphaerota archaeon]
MKKLWIFLALVVLVATQVAVLSSFSSISEYTWADESVTVVISKLVYAHLRVKVSISAVGNSGTVLLFSNGTQKVIPASSSYTFSVAMPNSGFFGGSFSTQSEAINLSDDHPINVAFLSNGTFTQTPYWETDKVSVYWFTVQGNAHIAVEGMGAGF